MGGGGQKIPKFCGRHIWMAPNGKLVWGLEEANHDVKHATSWIYAFLCMYVMLFKVDSLNLTLILPRNACLSFSISADLLKGGHSRRALTRQQIPNQTDRERRRLH